VAAGIQAVSYAASTDETRYVLNGVLLAGGKAVATDGHRMAFAPGLRAIEEPTIIPNRLCAALVHLGGEDGTLMVDGGKMGGGIVKDGVTYVVQGRLIEGKFPDYKQVIPKDIPITCEVDRAGLIAAIKRVVLVADGKSSMTRLDMGKDALTVTCQSPDTGEAADTVDATTKGAEVVIGVSGRYLLDALAHVAGDKVSIGVVDALSPLTVGPIDGTITALVMPMRI
jgi:DNA polymerase-3 subunit beta